MIKKMLPVIALVFLAACANVQGNRTPHSCPCAHSAECKCHHDEACNCCDGESGLCKLCLGKEHKHNSAKEAQPCPVCLEDEA